MPSMKDYEDRMAKKIEIMDTDFSRIRAGRANPRVLDKIQVEYYGSETPIGQIANITVPEARSLQIQPWDVSALKLIEKAILASDVGITPINDGKMIRLVFPELTEERRKELTKEIKKIGESFKIEVRDVRRDGMNDFKKELKDKTMGEDEIKSLEEKLQKATDKYCDEIDKHVAAKEKEIMSI